jgi:hypothetical protein
MYELLTDMDCPSNIKTAPPSAILHKHEAEKIRKLSLPAQNIGRTFKPFVMGADGTLGIHAAEVIDTLARKLTKQWDTIGMELFDVGSATTV